MTSRADETTPWILWAARSCSSQLRLFCLPYAGGGAAIFRRWQAHLPSWIQVCAIELPGRGTRFRERPLQDVDCIVAALADELAPWLDRPFAIYGHSMGGLLAFELARLLRRRRQAAPRHLLVSATPAPTAKRRRRVLHELPDEEFAAELERLDGTPKPVLRNQELMRLLQPVLRADFAVVERYRYAAGPPLSCAITAFGGTEDRAVPADLLRDWSEQTSGPFTLEMVSGNHFFVRERNSAMCTRVLRRLEDSTAESASTRVR